MINPPNEVKKKKRNKEEEEEEEEEFRLMEEGNSLKGPDGQIRSLFHPILHSVSCFMFHPCFIPAGSIFPSFPCNPSSPSSFFCSNGQAADPD